MRKFNHLLNSKWTAAKPVDRAQHFELKAFKGKTTQYDQVVCVMRCVVTRSLICVRLDELLDEDKWRKGWFRSEVRAGSSESTDSE